MSFDDYIGTRPSRRSMPSTWRRCSAGCSRAWPASAATCGRAVQGRPVQPDLPHDSGGRHYVLRRKPPGVLLPSAHAVDREFRVISALAKTAVPVAGAHVLCEDPSVIGSMFYVMDCVEGRVLWDPQLPGMTPNSAPRTTASWAA
jgi:hypothetical protein